MLRFTVLHSSWHADGEEFPAGDHEIPDASEQLVRLAAHAHTVGAIDVTEGLDLSHLQSQEDGEAAHAAAQDDGSWQFGQRLQARLDEADKYVTLAQMRFDEADVASAEAELELYMEKAQGAAILALDGGAAAARCDEARARVAAAETFTDEERADRTAALERANANRARVDAEVQAALLEVSA